jgi:hypothetical protein
MWIHHRVKLVPLLLILAACRGQPEEQAMLPTAHNLPRHATPGVVVRVAASLLPTTTPIISPELIGTSVPPTILTTWPAPLDQYRTWMEEARALHPYSEPLDVMWSVMLCESSGDANAVVGMYFGLFQFQSETWSGEWNPYRDLPILDPRAQIFATAKAWQDGNQHWWGCYQ